MVGICDCLLQKNSQDAVGGAVGGARTALCLFCACAPMRCETLAFSPSEAVPFTSSGQEVLCVRMLRSRCRNRRAERKDDTGDP